MGKENQNIMPNENEKAIEPESFSSPDFDPEKISRDIARSLCEPSENLYKRDPALKKNPFKAMGEVRLAGKNESEIPDPVEGLLIGAAKLETAKKELNLTPKQKKAFDGVLEKIHGAIAWAKGAAEEAKDYITANKVVRKTLIGAQVVGLTLTSAGCVNVVKPSEAAFTETPAPAETFTPTPTEALTPTPTETATATPTETRTAAEETSRYFRPEFQLDLEGNVDGISIPFTVGLHKSVVDRTEEPIKTISVNREDAPDLYAKFWLTICWQKYLEQHPNDAKITFAQYEDLVKNGEGEIEVAAVDENTDDQNNKILTFHPEKGFVRVSVDKSVQLPEEGNTLFSFYFGMNSKGQLVIAENAVWPQILSEQRGYDGQDGWNGNVLVDLIVSDYVAAYTEMVMVTDNEALISQKTYWKVAGQVTLPNCSLLFDPIIHNTQFFERYPLLTIRN